MKTNYFFEVPPSVDKTDRKKLASFISDRATDIQKTLVEEADDIIVSQEETKRELKTEISSGVDDILQGLEGMRSTFEWGFSELVWQIEKQRETLRGILETLQKPLDTQAKELKGRAEDAYAKDFYDDALRDFLKSQEKNPYDFTVYHNIGNIYLHKGQPDEALEYYEQAVKYAKPESSYHASFALLHIALIKYREGDFKEAFETTKKAIQLSPLLYEAYYQHSRYCAKVKEKQEAIYHLKKAIASDINYALKANSEEDFEEIREEVDSLFEELSNDARKVAKKRLKRANELITEASQENLTINSTINNEIEAKSCKISKLKKGGLFDCRKAVKTADQAYETAKSGLFAALESKIDDLEEKKENVYGAPFFVEMPLGIAGLLSWLGAPFFGIAFIISMVDDYYPAFTSWVYLTIAVIFGLILWANSRVAKREEKRKNKYKEKIEKLSGRFSFLLRNQSPESIEIEEENRVKPVRQTEKVYDDFITIVDMKIKELGECGIQFRSGDHLDNYLFRIATNGYYQLDLVQKVEAKEDPNFTTLTEDFSFAINQGESWNELKVKAVGPNIELYVNDILLDAISDETLQKGGVSVVGYTPLTQSYLRVLYDNFQASSVRRKDPQFNN